MVTATRLGKPYCVEIRSGQNFVLPDTQKNGKEGNAGMQPHELLESAPVARIGKLIGMAAKQAKQANVALPAGTAEVAIGRLDHETRSGVSPHFAAALSTAQQELACCAVQASPVACTPGKPVRIRPTVIATA